MRVVPDWFIGILGLAGFVSLGMAYQSCLEKGLRKRTITTRLKEYEIQAIFQRTVATFGWTLQRGARYVAISPLTPIQYTVHQIGKLPTKAHTLRLRMDAFTRGIAAADVTAHITSS